MASYLSAENPFVYGLKHISYQETENKFFSIHNENRLIAAYFAGRTIRFGVNGVGAITDLALQIFQCLLFTVLVLPVKVITAISKCKPHNSYSTLLFCPLIVVDVIRDYTTRNTFKLFAQDVEFTAKCLTKTDVQKLYCFAVNITLF